MMKIRLLTAAVIFSWLIAAAQAFCADAAPASLPLPSHPILEIDAGGEVKLSPGAEGEIKVLLPKGADAPAKKYYRLERTLQGARLEVFKSREGQGPVEIVIPESAQIKLTAKNASISVQKLAGAFSAEMKNASVVLDGCRGAINIKFKTGVVDLKNYAGEGKSVVIEGKTGTVSASVAGIAPGPGRIAMESDAIHFSIDRKTKIAVQASITEKGGVDTTLPINRSSPRDAYFIANGGTFLWELKLKNGSIDLNLPAP